MPKRKPIDNTFVRRQSSRNVRPPQKFDAAPTTRKCMYWTLGQKQSLLKTLKQFSQQDLQMKSLSHKHFNILHRSIKTKSVEDIKDYIESIIKSIPKEKDAYHQKDDTPLQQWVELFADQADASGLDCSSDISKMLLTAARENHFGPDFKRLYQFMDALFQEKNIPELSNIDSLVILDCIENLDSFLDSVDTTEQKDSIIKKSEQMKEFLYSKKDFIFETEMCDEIASKEANSQDNSCQQKNKKANLSLQFDESTASTSGTATNATDNKITLSLSSINPFGVPANLLNFKTDNVVV